MRSLKNRVDDAVGVTALNCYRTVNYSVHLKILES